MSDKLVPPHWLHPDAVLGAVEHKGADYLVAAIHKHDRKGHKMIALVEANWEAPLSHRRFAHHCKLVKGYPVKPELAALFGEGINHGRDHDET